jgi:DNA-binding CsgD family transcriptional regulator/tetratricopeptide (TPR) repeat protein
MAGDRLGAPTRAVAHILGQAFVLALGVEVVQEAAHRPPLIGRERHLRALTDRLESACRGAGGVVLLAGEAGIGKTRLVEEVHAAADRLGFLVAQGNCFEADRGVPYAPIADLLRAIVAARAPTEPAALLDEAGPALRCLLPELTTRLSVTAVPPPPDLEQHQLGQQLSRLLAGQAAQQPLLIVIEDLHWSDDGSLAALYQLARRAARLPLLLLLTYRVDELHGEPAHLLAELERERLAQEIALPRLSRSEVETLLRALALPETPPRRDLSDDLYRLTEGNPFFVEEVVKALASASEPIQDAADAPPLRSLRLPRTVQDAVQRRTRGLNTETRRVLTLAAVVGQRFDFSLLLELTGLSEPRLLDCTKALIEAQLVVEESADRFRFRHALTRQAVEVELLARERRALHRELVAVLERRQAGGLVVLVGELANHCYAGELWQQAVAYSRQAGEQAQALYAPRAAVEHFTQAFAALRALSLPLPADLCRARAGAFEMLGEFEQARADYELALAIARRNEDAAEEWEALLALGFLWTARDYGQAGERFQQALDLARAIGEPSRIARSLNRTGNWQLMSSGPAGAVAYHEQALTLFEQIDDRPGVAETLDLLGLASMHTGDTRRGTDCYLRAAALYEQLDDRRGLITSLAMLSAMDVTLLGMPLVALPFGYTQAAGSPARAIQMARDIGWRAGESFALEQISYRERALGNFGAALRMSLDALAIAEEIEHLEWRAAAYVSLGHACLGLLAATAARGHLERALALAHEAGSGYWIAWTTAPLAWACILTGDLDRAAVVLDALSGPDTPIATTLDAMNGLARTMLLLTRGEADSAFALLERIEVATRRYEPDTLIPSLALARAECLAALVRDAEAEVVLAKALDVAERHAALPLQWRLRLLRARLLLRGGRKSEAERDHAAVRVLIERLAATLPNEPVPEVGESALRDLFLAAARAELPQRAAPAEPVGALLSAREREVAALVARGLSNRAIAADLVLSERTVEYHVSNILTKLGATSRAQIAAWAVEVGLIR